LTNDTLRIVTRNTQRGAGPPAEVRAQRQPRIAHRPATVMPSPGTAESAGVPILLQWSQVLRWCDPSITLENHLVFPGRQWNLQKLSALWVEQQLINNHTSLCSTVRSLLGASKAASPSQPELNSIVF